MYGQNDPFPRKRTNIVMRIDPTNNGVNRQKRFKYIEEILSWPFLEREQTLLVEASNPNFLEHFRGRYYTVSKFQTILSIAKVQKAQKMYRLLLVRMWQHSDMFRHTESTEKIFISRLKLPSLYGLVILIIMVNYLNKFQIFSIG